MVLYQLQPPDAYADDILDLTQLQVADALV